MFKFVDLVMILAVLVVMSDNSKTNLINCVVMPLSGLNQ